MTARSPLDDFRSLLANLPNPDKGALAAATDRRKQLPAGEQMGRMATIAQWFAGWRGNARQPVMKPLTAVFAGNHGITAAGHGPWNMGETAERVNLLAAGGAMVSQICTAQNVSLKIFDLALDHPTGDITREAALDAQARTIEPPLVAHDDAEFGQITDGPGQRGRPLLGEQQQRG